MSERDQLATLQAENARLIALLDELQVPTVPSDMSFSVQVPGAGALATYSSWPRRLLRW